MKILVLNAGSSTQKSALFELTRESPADPVPPLWEGKLAWDGLQETLTVKNARGQKLQQQGKVSGEDRAASLERLLANLWSGPCAVLGGAAEVEVIGHRIVHGGPTLTRPTLVTPQVRQAIADVSSIAPLHNRSGLEGIDLSSKLFPKVPQIAVFDTGFHRTLPLQAKVYAGPYSWYEQGIRRYGFHGINHEYCAHRAAHLLRKELAALKIVSCHLGNGCSLAAIDRGTSVDTTMGFTPLEGLMMGTRSGSIDPGILTHLIRTGTARAEDLDAILNRQSGLLGISGVSGDMRDILNAKASGHEGAKLAFDIFVHRLGACIAAMAASLGGVDVLVFTAGIGENAAEVRSACCERLRFLGVELDEHKNAASRSDSEISAQHSRVQVLVVSAQEDWTIARECVRIAGRA